MATWSEPRHEESCGCSDCIRALLDDLDVWRDYQNGLIASPS